ncbi:unnamed protein product, partial [Penicillium discolor]
MALSPTLDRFLAEMEYPATRDDLLREAAREGLPNHDRAALHDLPEQSFSAAWLIRYRLARNALADALTPASRLAALHPEMNDVALSVLDLVPVRSGQTSAEAITASLSLAATADRLGYRRYWFAEHHNMPAVASTTPPVLIAAAATRTSRIRLGSGGVMLPNHAPLIVAEQFAALEAIAPGRIDLGLGRAPGSDPVITQLLRGSGTTSDVEQFPRHVQDIAALFTADGATVRFTSGGEYTVRATPAATGVPEVWLLGSSDYSAQLAASLGLPYVFANHFSGQGLERALDLYRTNYRPSEDPAISRSRDWLPSRRVTL